MPVRRRGSLFGEPPRSCARKRAQATMAFRQMADRAAARRLSRPGPVMHAHERMTAAVLCLLGGLAGAPPAAAARAADPLSSCPATLPISVTAPTTNAAALQRVGTLRVHALDGARVRNVHVVLRRGGRTVADASRRAAIDAEAALRLRVRGRLRAGRLRVVVSGRQTGCAKRRQMRRTLRLDERNLAVHVLETRRDRLGGRLAVTLGVSAGTPISGLRARLLDAAGTTIAQVMRRASARRTAKLDFALRGSATGRRWLLVTAGVGGEPARRAFADRIALDDEPGLAPGRSSPDAPAAPPPGAIVEHVALHWSGGRWRGSESAGFHAAGIGDGRLVCRPDTQWMRVVPTDRTRDATMMLWTFRDWQERSEYAIRESEMTRFTGPDFNEGFNKFQPAEKRASGTFYGVIGDGLPAAGGFGSGRSPTEVRLSWRWDFTDEAGASCDVDATFTSQGTGTTGPLATGLSLAWRGAAGVPADTTTVVPVPGLGRVRVRCDPGIDGVRAIVIAPDGALPGLQLTTHEGSDTVHGTIGATPSLVRVPNNGLVELAAPAGSPALRLVLSSRWKVDDPDPAANFCRLSGIVVAG